MQNCSGLGVLCHGKQRQRQSTAAGLGSAQATWETVTAQAAVNGQSSVRHQRMGICPLFLKGTSLAGLWVCACGKEGFPGEEMESGLCLSPPIPLIFAKDSCIC